MRGDNPETDDGRRQCGGATDHPGAGARDDGAGQYARRRRARASGSGKNRQGRRRRQRLAQLLEFRADPDSPTHDKNFAKDKNVIVYCASGGRSALSGKLLKDMGYERVYNLGGFKDWADAGGEVE